MSAHTCTHVVGAGVHVLPSGGRLQVLDFIFSTTDRPKYLIHRIKGWGYYLFHQSILSGFYWRVATIGEWDLYLTKRNIFCKHVYKGLGVLQYHAVTWFPSITSSILISHPFPKKWYLHALAPTCIGTSNPFLLPKRTKGSWSRTKMFYKTVSV